MPRRRRRRRRAAKAYIERLRENEEEKEEDDDEDNEGNRDSRVSEALKKELVRTTTPSPRPPRPLCRVQPTRVREKTSCFVV